MLGSIARDTGSATCRFAVATAAAAAIVTATLAHNALDTSVVNTASFAADAIAACLAASRAAITACLAASRAAAVVSITTRSAACRAVAGIAARNAAVAAVVLSTAAVALSTTAVALSTFTLLLSTEATSAAAAATPARGRSSLGQHDAKPCGRMVA